MLSYKFEIVSLIILLYNPGSLVETISVTCLPLTICALRESEVKLTCSYSTPSFHSSFWVNTKKKDKWRNEEHPEDLASDSDYAGRVSYTETTSSSSTLTISDLREKDSGEYHLVIITARGEKYISSSAVTLTVTDLFMTIYSQSERTSYLKCTTTCPMTSNPDEYQWFWNGQTVQRTSYIRPHLLVVSRDKAGSFSCSVSTKNKTRSSALCIFGQDCWNVIYTQRRMCGLEGSSVDFSCTYSYPSGSTVPKTFWHHLGSDDVQSDMSEKRQFAGRLEYLGNKMQDCTLRMKDLRKSDTGEYHFGLISSSKRNMFSGYPGVVLSVTGLHVKVSATTASEGQTVILSCSTNCTLPNSYTYIWYKNGQPVTNKPTKHNKLYLNCREDAGRYSCAVSGHEDLQSPAATLTDKCFVGPERSLMLMLIIVGVSIVLFLIFITGAVWICFVIRRKGRANTQTTPDNIYASLEYVHMSPNYDTLAGINQQKPLQ